MEIKIIAFGFFKKKDPLQTLFETYLKRITRYYKVSLVELKEFPAKKGMIQSEILKREEKLLRPHLKGQVFLLWESGKTYDTHKFKEMIFKKIHRGESITLILGSAHGLSRELLKEFPTLSLSEMTFPHLLARVMLIEQLYRAVTLEKNIDYHK